MNKKEIAELILRRRLQILVHSCLYYEFDTSLVTDATWASWAKELTKLQNDYGIPEYGFKKNMEMLINKINELTDVVNKMM